jgi:hypothetical protein
MPNIGPANVKDSEIIVVESNNLTSDQLSLIVNLRNKPTLAARVLLGVKLEWYQAEAIEDVWRKRFSIFCWSRQIGKTFSEAVLFSLLAILYPYEDAVFIAPSLRQAMNPFNYVRDFYNNHAVFRSMVRGKITKTRIEFKNSSSIIPLPMGDGSKILGTHASIIGIDEYATFTKEFIETVVMPMANRKKNPQSRGNRLSIIGTPLSKSNHYYPEFVRYKKAQAEDPNGDYHVSTYSFLDSDNMDMNILLNQAKAMTFERFARENLAEFTANMGGFFSEEIMRQAQDEIDIEFTGDSDNSVYVLGIDPPSVNNMGGFCIMKLVEDNKKVDLVFCAGIPAAEISAPQLVSLTIRLVKRFKILRLHVDQGGGGLQLAQTLFVPQVICDDFECESPVLLPDKLPDQIVEWKGARNVEDPISMINNNLEPLIIQVTPFSPHTKSAMYFNFRNGLQNGTIKLPTMVYDKAHIETNMLQNEMESLKGRLTPSSYLSLTKPDDGFDDRVDAAVLAYDAYLGMLRGNGNATRVGGSSHDSSYRGDVGGFDSRRDMDFPDRKNNDPWK